MVVTIIPTHTTKNEVVALDCFVLSTLFRFGHKECGLQNSLREPLHYILSCIAGALHLLSEPGHG